MSSLRCLLSALTQAGGGDLLFRFARSVQSCCGEGGALQADSALCGEHSLCSGHTGFAPYRDVCAFPVYTAQAPGCPQSGPCVECSSSFRVLHKSADSVAPAFCAFPGLSGPGSPRLGHPLPGCRCGAPFPSAVPARTSWVPAACVSSGAGLSPRPSRLQMSTIQNLRKSSDRNRGPVCRVGVGGFSGAEFAPFPSPCLLPPAGMGRLFSGVSQSLCFANRWQCVPAG